MALVEIQTADGPRKVRVCDYCKAACIPSGRYCSAACYHADLRSKKYIQPAPSPGNRE